MLYRIPVAIPKFVLVPLNEIAADYFHPVLKKHIQQLLLECSDNCNVVLNNKFTLANYNYIAIEGNIGAGKTSLTNRIAEQYNGKIILEQFSDNPFLQNFMKNPSNTLFRLSCRFLPSDTISKINSPNPTCLKPLRFPIILLIKP